MFLKFTVFLNEIDLIGSPSLCTAKNIIKLRRFYIKKEKKRTNFNILSM